jgi:hypothetical protein
MSDISMCRDATCPLRHECYRFSARANPYGQSYADFKYRGQEQGEPLEAGCEPLLVPLHILSSSWQWKQCLSAYVSIRQHTSAYVSIRLAIHT